MPESDLNAQLATLTAHIDKVEARLKLKGVFSADHKATAEELRNRYRALIAKLRAETADAEAHGRHVSDLELSVRQWLDGLEIDID